MHESYVLLRTVLKLNRIRYLPAGGQRAICFLSFLLALYRVINSLLLWEKVAAVRLTDEESLLVGTPHPPLSRSSFPHRGRLFLYPESPSVFLDKHCICGHKCKIRHTSFEIYRILEDYPLGYAPKFVHLLIFIANQIILQPFSS